MAAPDNALPPQDLEAVLTDLVDEIARLGQDVERIYGLLGRVTELTNIAVSTSLTSSAALQNLTALVTEMLKMMGSPPTADAVVPPPELEPVVRYIPFSLADYPPRHDS